MAGYNRVILVGNLTRDPEYKQLTSGQAVCRLGFATNRQFKNRQTGQMVQEVCYVDIDVWGAQAESCSQYLQKGRGVLVEGRLKFDTWQDPSGQNRSKHSVVADRVVFLSSGSDGDTQTTSESNKNTETSQTTQSQSTTQPAKQESMPQPESEMEKELFDQIESIKKKNQSKSKQSSESQHATESKESASSGEIEFKDQPPFEDELPF